MSSITVRFYLPLISWLGYLIKSYPILNIWYQNIPYLQDRRSNTFWGELITAMKSYIWVRWCCQKTNREWLGNLKELSNSSAIHNQIEIRPAKFGSSRLAMTRHISRHIKMSQREDLSPETSPLTSFFQSLKINFSSTKMNFQKPPAGGGVCVWIRSSLNWRVLINISGLEIEERVDNTLPWWVSCKKYMRSS